MKTELRRSVVLHAIFKEFREARFEQAFPNLADFSRYLGSVAGNSRGLSKSAISRWLESASPIDGARVTGLLDDESISTAVAFKCGLPIEIFSANDIAAAVSLAAPNSNDTYVPSEESWVLNAQAAALDQSELCSAEQRVVSALYSETKRVRKHLLITIAPFDSGISFLWHMSACKHLIPRHATAVYFLRPKIRPGNDLVHDFEGAISWLATRLSLPSAASGRTIVRKLIETRSTAILLAVSGSLDPRAEQMAQAALREHKDGDQPIAVIISSIAGERPVDGRFPRADRYTIEDAKIDTKVDERYPFFRSQWIRYCNLRNSYRPDEGGSRLKRARWHYEFLRSRPIYPINIRLRAFFASDLSNYSYFDPTAGFESLCNMPGDSIPTEIKMFREDVVKHVSLWDVGRREPLLRPLKWCSTAVYWLTEEAARDLGAGHEFADLKNFQKRGVAFKSDVPSSVTNVPKVSFSSFHETSLKVPAIISYKQVREDGREALHYVAGIGVKAIVQDHWMATDPAGRAFAHYRIAKRLYDKRHAKSALAEEFPLIPHWGRSGIFFLAECIRHLVRASAPIISAAPPFEPKSEDEFPAAPTRNIKGCDPFEVLSFCFGHLYWSEMDGNSTDDAPKRMLSQRHGLYNLSAEILQLLSKDRVLGEPHWALEKRLHGRYYASAAVAQLELGDLKSALMLFKRKLDYVQAAEPASLNELASKLELIGVKIELYQIQGLVSEIDEIARELDSYTASSEPNAQIEQIRLHCKILKAEIFYVCNQFDRALEMLDFNLELLSDERWVIEATHYLIATLGAKSELLESVECSLADENHQAALKLRDEAMKVASRQLWHFASRGEQHVALGFRVSIAHLFRNMGKVDVAEEWMNGVYRDILRYGCSERTYLSFLREAGRIVRSGRPARAFAFYLRPAAIRAASRGHLRAARVAFREANEALLSIKSEIESDGASWEARLAAELVAPSELIEEADAQARDYVAADPLFSFDLHWEVDWKTRLADTKSVDEEAAAFAAEFKTLVGGVDAVLVGEAT